jgi:[acyl-carrier-protein] S-malonyltransferase
MANKIKKAILFPGQGAQYPGMGKAFCAAFPEADKIFDQANDALGFDLKKICFEGSEDEVSRTDIGQPAILTTSISIITVLEERFGLKREDFTATSGLSLGDYTALVFAGVLSFEDAVKLVAKRGRYMQEDSDRHPSGMISLMGAEREQAEGLCKACEDKGVIVMANFLGPGQLAISGANAALEAAESHLKDFGIRRGVRLKVAGAFHSPLMKDGGEKLGADLEAVSFAKPQVPVASNVTGDYVEDPEEIRTCLKRQVTSPVLWHDTMERFIDDGIGSFFEPGPGKVLTGILRKIDRNLLTHNLDDPAEIDNFVAGYSEKAPAGAS